MQVSVPRNLTKWGGWLSLRGSQAWALIVGDQANAPSLPLSWYLSIPKLIAALPLMAATFVLVGYAVGDDRQARRAALVLEAHALADVVGREIDKYFILSNVLSHSAFLQNGDVEKFQRQGVSILADMPGVTLIVSMPDGRPARGLLEAEAAAPPPAERLNLIRRAFDEGAAFLSDVNLTASVNEAHASIEAPIYVDGKQRYELAVIFTLGRFGQLLQRQAGANDRLAAIVDRNGSFVARFPVGSGTSGALARAEFPGSAQPLQDSVATLTTINGEPNASAYAATAHAWTVRVSESDALIESGHRAPFLAALLVAVAMAASALLTYVNGRRIAGRIYTLEDLSAQLVTGGPITPPPTGVRELDALAGALAQASVKLRSGTYREERAEQALQRSEEHFRILADSLPQLVWTAGPDGRIDYTNARRELYGKGGLNRTDWDSIIHPEDRRATAEAWLRASASGTLYEKEHRLMATGRGFVWHLSRAEPLLDAQGAVVRWYGSTTDIDDTRTREQNIRSLMSEVNHRSRNLLAVAVAIARRSVVSGDSAQDFEQRFSQRLLGLVASQDVLTRHDWRGVPIEALVRAQSVDRLRFVEDRLTYSGPAILLNASAAQTLGLALHELLSNALKYGALSGERGRIEVSWRIEDNAGEPLFGMEWREFGGPPINAKPAPGFGSIIMGRMAAQGLNGEAELDFETDGVRWRLLVPLKAMVISS